MIKSIFLSLVIILGLSTPALSASTTVTGTASWYECTRGWCDGTATVALAGFLGGRYTGHINGYVEVCGDHCVTLPIVDYCQCYVGTPQQRIVDLNKSAWKLVTDRPYSTGLIKVTMTLGVSGITMPNTAMAQP